MENNKSKSNTAATTTAATKSIITTVVNGKTALDCIKSIKNRLETVEKSAFNIALECAYTLGVEIPAYTDSKGIEHGCAVIDKPVKKQADLLKLIGRSKATLSRWIKAFTLILENNCFNEFASGKYPFSYDKVILIFENDLVKSNTLDALMSMTVSTLEALCDSKQDADETDETDKTEQPETEPTAETEIAEFIYNGKTYKADKTAFEKWIEKHATLA